MDIEEKIKALQTKLKKVENKEVFPEKFIELANTYGSISELTREILFDLINRIKVFSSEKTGVSHIQTIRIHYNHVGFFEPQQQIPEICVTPRKGQILKYVPYSEYIHISGSETSTIQAP